MRKNVYEALEYHDSDRCVSSKIDLYHAESFTSIIFVIHNRCIH